MKLTDDDDDFNEEKNINLENEHWTYESAFHSKIDEQMKTEQKRKREKPYCGEFSEC